MRGQFTEQSSSQMVECPYCGSHYQPESEDFSEDQRDEECGECGKKYYLSQSISITHHAKPDCELNGDQHDYQPVSLRSGVTHPFCTVCEKCQPLPR